MSDAERQAPRPQFRDAWADLMSGGTAGRLLAVVFTGTMAFNMQDVLLEPYGGQIMGLSVSVTTLLTATTASGALLGFAFAARWLTKGIDPMRMGARGILIGIVAFSGIVFAAPLESHALFYAGAALIGFGGGLFSVATLTAAMTMPAGGLAGRGLALGAWGAAQATAGGLAIFAGGALRNLTGAMAMAGSFGPGLNTPAFGYALVYHLEIGLLFVTLIVLGPLVRLGTPDLEATPVSPGAARIGIAEFPT